MKKPNKNLQSQIEAIRKQLDVLEHQAGQQYKGPLIPNSPVRDYYTVIKDSNDPGYVNRMLIATPATGIVRMEWVQGRYGQIIPPNWSMVQYVQYVNGFIPMRYQVAEAQNMIARAFIEGDFEWLFLLEHDVIPPPDAIKRFDEYMTEKQVPVVSGLYFTRSKPSLPLIYRGRGTGSHYMGWQFGDKVWCDGVPTGCLFIHRSIIQTLWDESEPYLIRHGDGRSEPARRVFDTPRKMWFDPESGQHNMTQGTSDLDWCTRIIENKIFEKAGWAEYQEMEFPFLVDTNIFCIHINIDGEKFPKELVYG